MIAFLWCIAGLAVMIGGAELLVRGGTRVAARLGIPPLVIGLTVVALGTSMPELAVGVEAAWQGSGALAVGNIAGTNTANLLLILGLSAWISPLALELPTLRLNLPMMIGSALLLLALAWDGVLSRLDGAVLVAGSVAYTGAVIRLARRGNQALKEDFIREYGTPGKTGSAWETAWSVVALLVGIALTVVGADWLVDGASGLARMFGVSEAVIGLTIVALGTSSPELVTAVVGTLRNERDIAIGNLLGSSVYNILGILGVTSLVPSAGLAVEANLVRIDIPVMAAVTIVCAPVFISGRRVSRLEGALFVTTYGIYLTYLVVART